MDTSVKWKAPGPLPGSRTRLFRAHLLKLRSGEEEVSMKNFVNKSAFLTASLGILAAAQAQPSSLELTCRAKAKDIAAKAYDSCLTEARTQQIEQIRKEYQKQLADLKAKYDRELKKVSGKKAASGKASAATGSTPKATHGIAKSLPTRKETLTNPPPVQQSESEEKAVVTPEPAPAPAVENETPASETPGDLKIELVPSPETTGLSSTTSGEVF